MISELNDEEILDFLMTSDFEGDYSPQELKYLLTKWRYFYRVLYGKLEVSKLEGANLSDDIKNNSENFETEKIKMLSQIATLKNNINNIKQKKLSMKERFFGKIITKDEN